MVQRGKNNRKHNRQKQKLTKHRFMIDLIVFVGAVIVTVSSIQIFSNRSYAALSHQETTEGKSEKNAAKAKKRRRIAREKKIRQNLTDGWQAILGGADGNAEIAVYSEQTGKTYEASNTDDAQTYAMASTVKVSVLAQLLHNRGGALSAGEQNIAANMIEYSDNDAATTLVRYIGGTSALNTLFDALGMQNSATASGGWGATETTAADQVLLMNAIAYGTSDYLDKASRSTMLKLMGNVTDEQDWGISAGSETYYLKNGWLARTGGWVVASIGYIPESQSGAKDSYTIAVYTENNKDMAGGQATIEKLARVAKKTLQPKAYVEEE